MFYILLIVFIVDLWNVKLLLLLLYYKNRFCSFCQEVIKVVKVRPTFVIGNVQSTTYT